MQRSGAHRRYVDSAVIATPWLVACRASLPVPRMDSLLHSYSNHWRIKHII